MIFWLRWLVYLAACALVAACLLFVAKALAQHPGHAEGHDVYKTWKRPGMSMSCCGGEIRDVQGNKVEGDCRPTRAYVDEHGNWRAWAGSYWIIVPPAAMLPTDLMGDGRNHVCERYGVVLCFSPAAPRI